MEPAWETAAAALWPTAALVFSAACFHIESTAAAATTSADTAAETACEATQLVCQVCQK